MLIREETSLRFLLFTGIKQTNYVKVTSDFWPINYASVLAFGEHPFVWSFETAATLILKKRTNFLRGSGEKEKESFGCEKKENPDQSLFFGFIGSTELILAPKLPSFNRALIVDPTLICRMLFIFLCVLGSTTYA